MEFKGTKGEWTAFKPEESNGYVYVDSDKTSQGGVATCYNHMGNAIEDAKLIAAAPELLDALQEMKNIFYIIAGTNEVAQEDAMIKAEQAINKALN